MHGRNNEVVWLASYPKAGNTWLRFLLTHYATDRPIAGPIVSETFPDVHVSALEAIRDLPQRLGIKTHFEFRATLPFLDETRAAIYVVRNPLDVMVSGLNFCILNHLGKGWTLTPSEMVGFRANFIEPFLRNRGHLFWEESGFGTLIDNVESWTDNFLEIPCLAVRYEDLLKDTGRELAQIVEFLGIPLDEERLARAVAGCTFSRMRQLEEEEIVTRKVGYFFTPNYDKAYGQGYRFMNRGQAKSWREVLTEQQAKRACDVFGPIMERFRYLPKRWMMAQPAK